MSIIPYMNSAGSADFVSDEYLRIISNHRDIIIADIMPTKLGEKEMGFYRHRFHAYLLDNNIPIQYHLPIMLLNNFQSEFDFGKSRYGNGNNDITTVYIPLIETLDKYVKKIQYKSGN